KLKGKTLDDADLQAREAAIAPAIPQTLQRKSAYLTHPVFNSYHSEHEMLRNIKSLEAKDLTLCHSMIPLGSCTMKLNERTDMVTVAWREFGGMHRFAPNDRVGGYMQLLGVLDEWLSERSGCT